MTSPLQTTMFNGVSDFFNGVATQSLRLNDNDSAYIHRTPGSASNRRTWTYSCWYKRGNLTTSQNQAFFSAGSGAGDFTMLYIDGTTDDLRWYDYDGSTDYGKAYDIFLRDTASWYHIVYAFDTTQATDSNRVKVYVNGTQQTVIGTDYGWMGQNYQTRVNDAKKHNIGKYTGNNGYVDGYLAEINFVDGTQLTADSFGETKNGVWIPKEYTGSYGTQGFHLEFKETGDGSSTASSSTIGADTSGQTNHFIDVNLDAVDSNMPDCPENNFCTWNPLSNTGVTLANGNLETSVGASHVCGGTMAVTSGKWYWECTLKSTVNGSNPVILGFVSTTTIAHAANYEQGVYFYTDNGSNKNIVHVENNSATQTITVPSDMLPIAVDEVMQYAYDGDTGKIWFGKNNVWADNDGGTTGNPSAGANPTFTLADTTLFMTPLRDHGGVAWTGHANFGQLTNAYTAPTDFNALSTANIPEPTISPNEVEQADDHFNTILYTGNASPAEHAIGFRPNLVWGKKRGTAAQNHWLLNDVTNINKRMSADNTDSEQSDADGTTFNANGSFTTANNDLYINNNSPYVVWAWKGNGTGTATSNTAGSINSTVSVNEAAGFSIVSYTGTGANATVGHGIGIAPKWILMKRRDSAQNWVVYHTEVGNKRQTFLNLTNAQTGENSVYFNNTSPSSTVFSLGSDAYANADGGTYVAYCWAEIEGFSRFDFYLGNGSASGTFVYTGFRPAFVMTKKIGATGNWYINDTGRYANNPTDGHLYADSNAAESGTGIDILSNGFKPRNTDSSQNSNGNKFIYMAFAEAPFKYANAR